jgi:hypothetical protein
MKYLRLFESFENTDEICRKYNIKNYTINSDGSIDVDGYVWLYRNGLTKLPLKFNKVNNWFYCHYNYLTSLEGSPVEVDGNFWCHYNNLTSFEFVPKIIRGDFDCSDNNIKSFEYFNSYVKGDFCCDNNPIHEVWRLFKDTTKIELLNDFDIFRDEDTDEPSIFIDRLNDFLEMIGKDPVKKVEGYKNI